MKNKPIYEAVSRVVSDGKVIGFMVRLKNKSKEIYMSLDVISFGLSQNSFEIKDVKLASNGKPRGCNGFLLSKLPITDLENDDYVSFKLYKLLLYIVRELGVTEDIRKDIKFNTVGVTSNCSVTVVLDEYKDMNVEVANQELNKNLKFYQKHLPKEMKGCYDKIEGIVEDKGQTVLTISSSRVKEAK